MELFFLIICAAIAIHRIWNYEVIFQEVRNFIMRNLPPKVSYVFMCSACNALWITIMVAAVAHIPYTEVRVVLLGFAAYPFVRLVMWGYTNLERLFTRPLQNNVTTPSLKNTPPHTEKQKEKSCTSCEQQKENMVKEAQRVSVFEKRVVILTTLANFNASYSLSSCVLEQARSLAEARPNWLIQVWTMQIADLSLWPADMPKNVEVKKIVPQIAWLNDEYNPKSTQIIINAISRNLVALGNATVITHDILFQRSYLTFAAAIHLLKIKHMQWWHQAHSGPSPLAERPSLPLLYRYSLPPGHRLLNINEAHIEGFKAHYGIKDEDIDTCPNIRDLRSLLGCSPQLRAFISKINIMNADVAQVYPLSTTRMHHKGLKHVIRIFGELKKAGSKVCLVIANAHANGNEHIINSNKEVAKENGLTDDEVIFTSDHFPKQLSQGLSQQDVQHLFQFTNVFIFPTIAEASSLVLTEAALASTLIVTNTNVPAVIKELCPASIIAFPFDTKDDAAWPVGCAGPDTIAQVILCALRDSPANATKRWMLKYRNSDYLGTKLALVLEQPRLTVV